MSFSIIVAVDENNAIGKGNNLLVRLPNDMKWFRKHTLGHTVIMGRKTYESLPNGALPKRRNIVLSRHLERLDDAIVVHSVDEVFDYINEGEENFVIGGGQVFRLFLPYTDKLYVTRIHTRFDDADTFFPEFDLNEWELVFKEFHSADEKNIYSHSFCIYFRKKIK